MFKIEPCIHDQNTDTSTGITSLMRKMNVDLLDLILCMPIIKVVR